MKLHSTIIEYKGGASLSEFQKFVTARNTLLTPFQIETVCISAHAH